MISMKITFPTLLVLCSLSASTIADVSQEAASSAKIEMSVPIIGMNNMQLNFEEIAQQYMQNPKVVGEARLKIMFWKIYDAKLSAANGQWQADSPMALSLTYLRDFEGKDIASRSVDEMRDIGYKDEVVLGNWFELMHSLFPNVKEGENITGVLDKNQHTHFYHQGKLLGSIDDIAFGQSFFGIWLSEKTSEPKMRKTLLGLG